MAKKLEMLDVVALLIDVPEKQLVKGQVGTIVEIHKNNFFEVEFCDTQGQTLATIAVEGNKLLLLHYKLETA